MSVCLSLGSGAKERIGSKSDHLSVVVFSILCSFSFLPLFFFLPSSGSSGRFAVESLEQTDDGKEGMNLDHEEYERFLEKGREKRQTNES